MPDGSYICQNEYISVCPLCDDDQYGLTWNLYYMKDLEQDRERYPFVDPYTVDF